MDMPEPSRHRPLPAPHLTAFFAALLPPFSSLLVLKFDPGRPLVRFHATQSVIFGCAVLAGYALLAGFAMLMRDRPEIGMPLTLSASALFVTVWLLLWLVQLIAALSGREWEMPVFGSLARRIIARGGKK